MYDPTVNRWRSVFSARVHHGIVGLLLASYAGLVAVMSWHNSPNLDEVAHLPAGVSHWEFGRFELYRVNPPLVRMMAAVGSYAADMRHDWSRWGMANPYARSEFTLGTHWLQINQDRSFRAFTYARLACLPLLLLGGVVCFRWASELHGSASGWLALTLYCTCPNLLAYGSSITPDAAAAAIGVCAGYTFWRWLQQSTWSRAWLAGAALGVAELTKTTWIVLFGLWPVLWLIVTYQRARLPDSDQPERVSVTSAAGQLAVILLVAVYLVNLGYGFAGSGTRLGDFTFISHTLTGENRPPDGGNRFAGSWLGQVPVPFPEQYVRGIDVQKFDFEQGKWSYLRGEQQRGGWWHYYLYALAIKTPIGTLALFIFAVVLSLRRCIERSPASPSSHTNDVQQGGNSATAGSSHTLVVLLPAVVVLALVSSQLGFNRYVRYVLPALPWLYIFASRTATVLARQRPLQSALVLLAVGATVIESLAVFPHSLSFFNQCVGGPRGGHAHLVDANIDWGQDLLYLQEWYEQHLQARPLHVAYFGPAGMDPQYAGIDWRPVPKYDPNPTRHAQPEDTAGPQPGWFAVSVNYLRGYRHYEYDRPVYTYFLELEPVAMAGYSMYIYHLTLPDANRLRAERGLPPLPDRPQRDATP